MAFDQAWEQVFKAKKWGRYPSEEIVRFVAMHYGQLRDRRSARVLDVGCGGGAHTWFLAREGFDTYGIDGSASAIQQTRELLTSDGLNADLRVGDFIQLDYPNNFFDAVIDAGAIQHNRWDEIVLIHQQIWSVLKPGGFFAAIMINEHTAGWESAERVEDNTLTNFCGGPIQSQLLVHFFTDLEVKEMLAAYEGVTVETTTRTVCNGAARFGHFVVAGRKPQSKCMSV